MFVLFAAVLPWLSPSRRSFGSLAQFNQPAGQQLAKAVPASGLAS